MNVHRLVTHLWSNSSRKRANQKPLALRHPCAIDEAQYFVVPSAYTRIELSVHPVILTSAVGQFLIPANQGRKMLMKRSIYPKTSKPHSQQSGRRKKQKSAKIFEQKGAARHSRNHRRRSYRRVGVWAYRRKRRAKASVTREESSRRCAKFNVSRTNISLFSAYGSVLGITGYDIAQSPGARKLHNRNNLKRLRAPQSKANGRSEGKLMSIL
jgi:hypothetical protein